MRPLALTTCPGLGEGLTSNVPILIDLITTFGGQHNAYCVRQDARIMAKQVVEQSRRFIIV